MRRLSTRVLILVFLVIALSDAQEHPYSISVYGSFTTSSRLFHSANDPDEFIRNQFFPLDNIFGIGVDFRRAIESIRLQLGLSIEYLTKTETFNAPITTSKPIPSIDGFTAVPVELSGYFTIPVGNETVQLYMGGGAGIYFGSRRYAIADVDAPTVGRNMRLGIHVLSGVQYAITPSLSLRSEIKFRNVQIETTNKFLQATARYKSTSVPLPQQPIISRINIDGMTLTLGIAYRF